MNKRLVGIGCCAIGLAIAVPKADTVANDSAGALTARVGLGASSTDTRAPLGTPRAYASSGAGAATTAVSIVASPQSPLRIEPVAITQSEPFALSYRATNISQDTVLQYKLVAFVFTQSGIGRGYHTLPSWNTLASGTSRIGTFQLDKLKVTPYDRVVVGVQTVGVGNGTLAASIDELFAAAKRVASGDLGGTLAMASTALSAFGDCDAGFCNNERSACQSMCNSQGCPVSNFSCNRTECSSSCTCGAKCQ